MAYSDLQNNQTVSYTNLQSGVAQGAFTSKTTIPTSNEQVTKADVNIYVNINTSLPSYVAKASNRLITKQDLSGITVASPYIMYGVAATAGYKSIDGGNTFTALSGLPSLTWTAIAGDVTGNYIAAVSYNQPNTVYVSNDGGASFTSRSLNNTVLGFYPTGISMSNNGQYIAVAGVSAISNNKSARVAVSDNYGILFSTIFSETATYKMAMLPTGASQGKVSVSGNGQYITAIFAYEVVPGFPNNPRPWSYRVVSSNYGATFTKTGVTEFAGFGDIALDYTGQNQFLTLDWTRPGIFGELGIKAYVSSNYGVSFNERFSNTNPYFSLNRSGHVGFFSATITDDGKTMVGATTSQVWGGSSEGTVREPLVLVSSNYGVNFTFTEGYIGNRGIAGGNAITTGVTNNYIAMMLYGIGQFNYSNNGGLTFVPKAITNYYWTQVYRKAFVYAAPPPPCLGANWVASGTYYYTCSAGSVTSTIVYIDDRSCSSTYNQYKLNDVIYVTSPANASPSTTQTWVDTEVTRCESCVNQKEQVQTNVCATGYNTTRWVAGGSACSTAADWTLLFGSYTCSGCNKYYDEIDLNTCSATYNQIRISSVLSESNSTYCGGCCGQSTTQVWTATGEGRCLDCVSQIEQQQTRLCGIDYESYRWISGGSNCDACCGQSTAADWTLSFGSYSCSGCDKYYNEIDLNSCSSTYNEIRISATLAESNSTFCGGNCGQNTTADWTIAFGSYGCSGCDKYYMEIDLNQYSATYNQTRVSGSLVEANSSYCCTPDPCYQYYVSDYGWVYYTDCLGHFYSQYMNPWDSFCATSVSGGMVYSDGTCGGFSPS
jgi:hypothetical protein